MAVLPVPEPHAYKLRDADIEVFTTKDSGPGGQHRNKTESAVVMRHRPTGVEAKAASKSQHANRRQAREVLEARVAALLSGQAEIERNESRSQQIGSGMRGDKIRTYRARDDIVLDHRGGKKLRLRRVLEGFLD